MTNTLSLVVGRRGSIGMADPQSFELWLEFEHTKPQTGDDAADDFVNVQVRLTDGRRYALNIWTFEFLRRARYPWPYEEGIGEPAEYLLPPDLFVKRLDRPTLERVVSLMLANDEMRDEWLCQPEADPD